MFAEQGAFELVFLAAVALIVVGPKDLPVLMRKVGKFTAKMRGLAAEFRASFDEMARQSELDELRKEVEALRQNVQAPDIHAMMGTGPIKRDLEQHWDELHHGLIPAPAAASPGDAQVHPVHSVHPVSEPASVSADVEVHSVHSVHPVSEGALGETGAVAAAPVHSVHPESVQSDVPRPNVPHAGIGA